MQPNMKGGAQRIGLNRRYKLGKDTHEDFFRGIVEKAIRNFNKNLNIANLFVSNKL